MKKNKKIKNDKLNKTNFLSQHGLKKSEIDSDFIKQLPKGPKSIFLHLGLKHIDAPFLFKNQKKYGNTFSYFLKKRLVVFFSEPKAISEIGAIKQEDFIRGPSFAMAKKILGPGLISNDNPIHREQKTMLSSPFHSKNYNEYAQEMSKIVEEHISKWKNKEEIKINSELSSMTFEIVSKIMFGLDLSMHSTTFYKNLNITLNGIQKPLPFKINNLKKYNIPYFNKFKKSTELLKKIATETFDDNKNNENSNNILGILSDAVKNKKIPREEAIGQVLNLLVSGHETTSSNLVWALSHLSNNPEIWKLIKEESNEILKYENTGLFLNKLMGAKTTEKVINETLRLYPTVWGITRTAINDTEIDNVLIKSKTIVLFSSYVSHRNPKYFYDPENFIPERWHDGFKENLEFGAYFPFYMGQNKCIGDGFANLEMRIILLKIANKMDLSLKSKFPEPKFATLLKIKNQVVMTVNKENDEGLD